MREEAGRYPVKKLCAAVQIARGSYYRSLRIAAPGPDEITEAILRVFEEHQGRYGSRRIEAELRGQERRISRQRIQRVLREQGLRAIQPRSFVPKTTHSRHYLGFAPNLLLERTWPKGPNEVLVGDITYLPLASGKWAYLATWCDLFSRKIVGWAVAGTMGEYLIVDALKMVLGRRRLRTGAIVHSDRGGQYAGKKFRRLLAKHQLKQSMSRAGESYDNAFAESFFSRFKAELVGTRKFADVTEARLATFSYIEGYYNRIRRHSSLGYLSPEQYERTFTLPIAAAASEMVKVTRLIIDSNLMKGLNPKTRSCLSF